MKRLTFVALGLFVGGTLLLFGVRLIGHHWVEWPIQVTYRQPLPNDPPFDQVIPGQLADFKRQTFSIPLGSTSSNERMINWGVAQYTRPGDLNKVTLEVRQFSNVQIARLLINPSDWRLHSSTTNKFYAILQPISFVYTATQDGYRDYHLDYVNGAWNILIESTSAQTLLAFANHYPF